MVASAQKQERDSMMVLGSLMAFKSVINSLEAGDRHLWGNIYLVYIVGWFVFVTRSVFVAFLASDQPAINRVALVVASILIYLAIMTALGVAGLFVKECRSLVPMLTRLSFVWPDVSSRAKAQLLIFELTDRITNRRRGIGFRIGGLTSPITKLVTLKATFHFARGFLLVIKKYHPSKQFH